MPKLLAAGPDKVGDALVGLFVRTWDSERTAHPVIVLLQAATTEPRAADLLAEFMRTRLFGPLLAELGSDRAELRSNLVASQLGGLGLARYILAFDPLASASRRDIVRWIGPTIQRYLTGSLD